MALQNRVTPLGEIVATAERGLFTGNRGILHDPATRTLFKRRWTSRAWLTCALDFQGRRRDVMANQSWTEMFFLDEATALAAGHRPCFFCRREAARAFQARFRGGETTPLKAGEIDRVLHAERLAGGHKRLHALPTRAAGLPDGTMVLQADAPHLILGGLAHPWSFAGYDAPLVPAEDATLITPPSIVAVLAAGYRPILHASAG